MQRGEPLKIFVARAAGREVGLPLGAVVEALRPLPVEPWPAAPDFVLGLARLRGAPAPVVDLGRILGAETVSAVGRFVHLRVENRPVALAVEAVEGLRELEAAALEALPPLLSGGALVEALAPLDGGLLILLRAARLLPARELPA